MNYDYEDRFITIYKTYIKRQGSKDLLDFLETKSNFMEDPASTKYHLNKPGGLVQHSLNVYDRLYWLCGVECTKNQNWIQPDIESIAIVGLLHDICKTNTYRQELKNVKVYDEDVVNSSPANIIKNDAQGSFIWSTQTVYIKDDLFPYGHGEKSVYMISKYMKLKDEEAFAIRYHMSSWNKDEADSASKVFEMNEFAFLTHLADEFATFVDEV